MYVKAACEATPKTIGALNILGYFPITRDGAIDVSIILAPEHAEYFEYIPGTPHVPGTLALKDDYDVVLQIPTYRASGRPNGEPKWVITNKSCDDCLELDFDSYYNDGLVYVCDVDVEGNSYYKHPPRLVNQKEVPVDAVQIIEGYFEFHNEIN